MIRMRYLALAILVANSGAARAQAVGDKELVRRAVLDVLDQTASAKLVAYWGVDYLLLAKYDGRWMITNVVWQTPPKK